MSRAGRRIAVTWIRRRPWPLDRTLVVSGSGRSGTTWLASLLRPEGGAVVFEPSRVVARSDAGPAALWDVVPTHPGLPVHLDAALAGRLTSAWTLRESTVGALAHARRAVVKEIRWNVLLGHLLDHRPVLGWVHVIRDPAATVRSQLRFEGPGPAARIWEVPPVLLTDRIRATYPALARLSEPDPDDLPSVLVTKWAIEQLAALDRRADPRLHVVSYEAVRADPVGILGPLRRSLWGRAEPTAAVDLAARAAVPSSVSRPDQAPLPDELERDVASAVARLVSRVGIEVGTDDDGHPTYRLRPCTDPGPVPSG